MSDYPCGPESWKSVGLPQWVERLVPQFVFRTACREHDAAYLMGGTPADRKRADDAFYQSMKEAIAGKFEFRIRFPRLRHPILHFAAWTYMRLVRQKGDAIYNYRTDR